ncbi:MAG: hypothetical protein ACKOBV_11515, partial [Candidatus Kapaibacterium sp.]
MNPDAATSDTTPVSDASLAPAPQELPHAMQLNAAGLLVPIGRAIDRPFPTIENIGMWSAGGPMDIDGATDTDTLQGFLETEFDTADCDRSVMALGSFTQELRHVVPFQTLAVTPPTKCDAGVVVSIPTDELTQDSMEALARLLEKYGVATTGFSSASGSSLHATREDGIEPASVSESALILGVHIPVAQLSTEGESDVRDESSDTVTVGPARTESYARTSAAAEGADIRLDGRRRGIHGFAPDPEPRFTLPVSQGTSDVASLLTVEQRADIVSLEVRTSGTAASGMQTVQPTVSSDAHRGPGEPSPLNGPPDTPESASHQETQQAKVDNAAGMLDVFAKKSPVTVKGRDGEGLKQATARAGEPSIASRHRSDAGTESEDGEVQVSVDGTDHTDGTVRAGGASGTTDRSSKASL